MDPGGLGLEVKQSYDAAGRELRTAIPLAQVFQRMFPFRPCGDRT